MSGLLITLFPARSTMLAHSRCSVKDESKRMGQREEATFPK